MTAQTFRYDRNCILGYTLPISIAQTIISPAFAVLLGLEITANHVLPSLEQVLGYTALTVTATVWVFLRQMNQQ